MLRLLAISAAVFGIRLWAAPLNKFRLSVTIPKLVLKSKPKLKFQESQLISLLTSIHQELIAGLPVIQAIANVVHDQPKDFFSNSREALTTSSDAFVALSLDAKNLENPALQQLVTILNINQTSGASITKALDMMIKSALTRQEQSAQIDAELSGVKATITVLALLPILGVILGLMMGVNVAYWLLTNPVGWLCLTFASLLEALGLLWVRKLIRGVH